MNTNMELSSLIELCKLRREKPEEYKAFLDDAKLVIRDIALIGTEVVDDIEQRNHLT